MNVDRLIAGAVNGTVMIQSAQCLYGKVIRVCDPSFYQKARKDTKKMR